MARTYSIAELAGATGVPAATIRRYAKLGLVAPRGRRFGDGERLRVIAVRDLRATGVSMRELRAAFARKLGTRGVLAIHLAALDHDRARQTRAAAAIRGALGRDDLDASAVIRRLDALDRVAAI